MVFVDLISLVVHTADGVNCIWVEGAVASVPAVIENQTIGFSAGDENLSHFSVVLDDEEVIEGERDSRFVVDFF